MSLACLYASLFTCGWNMGMGGRKKVALHPMRDCDKALWSVVWGPPSSLSCLAPHLPCPSVHLSIAHKPTPSIIIAITIHYTVLAHLLTLWDHNSLFNRRNGGLENQSWISQMNSRTKCCWLSPVRLLHTVKQHQQNYGIIFLDTDIHSTTKETFVTNIVLSWNKKNQMR